MSEQPSRAATDAPVSDVVKGNDNPRSLFVCRFVRIVPARFALSLFFLTLALAAFTPALAEDAPRAFDKAALRAEAEAMLLPDPSLNLKPAPDVWKIRCGALTPYERETPSYYGTPLPEGLDGCYSIDFTSGKIPDYSFAEIARFDPSTIPNEIILEPSFALYPGMDLHIKSYRWYEADIPMSTLVRKAREGNPLAAIKMSDYFTYGPYTSDYNSRSHFFWIRMADALTRPGWAYETYPQSKFDIGENMPPLLGWPLDMLALGGKLLDNVPHGETLYKAWLRECALRGRSFVWSIWAHMYGYNTIDAAHPGGLFDRPDPTKGYAMAVAGSRLPRDLWDNETYTNRCAFVALRLASKAPENGLDRERGEALAGELYAVFAERRRQLLDEQRRRRAEALPEVTRQIDAWLKETETRRPKWLKKKWPEYPAYGEEHE